MSVFGHENVCRLDIAVNDAFPMSRVQTFCNLHGERDQFFGRQGPAQNAIAQGSALQSLHHNEVLAILLPNLVDGANVGMIQGGSRPRLALKTFQRSRIGTQFRRQKLQSHAPAQG